MSRREQDLDNTGRDAVDDNESVGSTDSQSMGITAMGLQTGLPAPNVAGHVAHDPDTPVYRAMAIQPRSAAGEPGLLRSAAGGFIGNEIGSAAPGLGPQLSAASSKIDSKVSDSAPTRGQTNAPTETAAPGALIDIEAPSSGWQEPQLRETPRYHPVDMCKHRLSLEQHSLQDVLKRITRGLRMMSIQAKFMDDPVAAALLTVENTEMHLAMWKSRTSNEVLLEIHRTKGDGMIYANYVRRIVEAASSDDIDEQRLRVDDIFDRRVIERTEATINRAVAATKAMQQQADNDHDDEDDDSDLSSASGKGDAIVATPAPTSLRESDSDDEQSREQLSCLEIVHKHLTSSKLADKQLALKSLVSLTDARKTVIVPALESSLAVLTGSVPSKKNDAAFAGVDRAIHDTVVSLVLRREFPGFDVTVPPDSAVNLDDGVKDHFPSDSEDDSEGSARASFLPNKPSFKRERRPAEFVRFLRHSHHLALACLVNAIEAISSLEGHEALGGVTLKTIIDNASSSSDMFHELVSTLLELVRCAKYKCHRAFLAAKGLRYICRASPSVRAMVQNDSTVQSVIRMAHRIGCERHWLLKTACQELWRAVYRSDEAMN